MMVGRDEGEEGNAVGRLEGIDGITLGADEGPILGCALGEEVGFVG